MALVLSAKKIKEKTDENSYFFVIFYSNFCVFGLFVKSYLVYWKQKRIAYLIIIFLPLPVNDTKRKIDTREKEKERGNKKHSE